MTDCSGDGCIPVGAREDGVSVLFIRVTTSTRSMFIITEFTLLNWNIPEHTQARRKFATTATTLFPRREFMNEQLVWDARGGLWDFLFLL